MKLELKIGIAALLAVMPAAAHHSFAMFDSAAELQLVGVVKEFQWTNPHVWIHLEVNQDGKPLVYGIEGSSPNGLSRKGWKRTTFKAGDKVTIVVHPLKNGEAGGSFVRAIAADGSTVTP